MFPTEVCRRERWLDRTSVGAVPSQKISCCLGNVELPVDAAARPTPNSIKSLSYEAETAVVEVMAFFST